MCILFIALDQHPKYPLLIAANRDEDHARASEKMHYWSHPRGILAGRDGHAGGTWFGVNGNGRIAAVTNYNRAGRQRTTHPAHSRGELTARFLRNADSRENYQAFLAHAHRDFNPFNLVYGELRKAQSAQLYCFSSTSPHGRRLKSGFHSIGNGAIDRPCPKTARGVELLQDKIVGGGEIDHEQLLQMMRDQRTAEDADALVPRRERNRTPENHRSSIFIVGEQYGTRSTTLLLGTQRRLEVYEYTYLPSGRESGRQHYSVVLPPPQPPSS